MYVRTIVSLERAQLRALKARARAQGVSVAEFMRRLVAERLGSERAAAAAPASAYERIVALGSSGHRDVADRHDARLAEVLRADHDR